MLKCGMTEYEILKRQIESKKTTALIVGAGAVQNSWKPIIRVMEKRFPDVPLTPDMTNCLFATLIYQLRSRTSKFAKPSNVLAQAMNLMKQIRTSLCEEIAKSQKNGELLVHEEFNAIADKFLFDDTELLTLVTTNWDTVIDEALLKLCHGKINPFQPLHLHGIYSDPTHIYLPTETTSERYMPDSEQDHHMFQHDLALDTLSMVRKIVIYGLSLSPLDAELLNTLSIAINNKNLKCIYIVDPNHKLIAGRAQTLRINQKNLLIKGCHPGSLNELYDYSLRVN